MHQEYFSILSARVPSGSLPQSILNKFSARVHSGSVFSCPAQVCLVRRNLYKRFSFKRSFPSAVSEYLRMQMFSALNVRSHQRRKFSSLTFAYRDDHDLKLTGARTFESPGPPSFFNPLYDAARDPPSESISWKGIQTLSTPNVCPV